MLLIVDIIFFCYCTDIYQDKNRNKKIPFRYISKRKFFYGIKMKILKRKKASCFLFVVIPGFILVIAIWTYISFDLFTASIDFEARELALAFQLSEEIYPLATHIKNNRKTFSKKSFARNAYKNVTNTNTRNQIETTNFGTWNINWHNILSISNNGDGKILKEWIYNSFYNKSINLANLITWQSSANHNKKNAKNTMKCGPRNYNNEFFY